MSAFIFKFILPLFVLASAATLTACEKNDGTFEEAGEDVDEAVEDAKDKIKDATN
jgi:predicted small secreted protein